MDMHAPLGGAIPTPAPACPHAPQTLEAHLRRWDRMPTQGHTGPRRLTCERVHLHPPLVKIFGLTKLPKTPYRAFLLILWLVRRRDARAARDRLS